ncbi:MAG: 50S ribosome-binding GTPase, partial [Candidatus Omnitrophica bacterium]|nr:50S ribosome-binding GTPase [Candidatus Omnitrophota bacterium]
MVQTKDRLPNVAIVGRPNVGKSSLFNRILKMRRAVVYQEAGTTRDRVSQEIIFGDKKFVLTDTGGFVRKDKDRLFRLIKEQIKKAVRESDILLFVCDGQAGLDAQDLELAKMLRKANKKIFFVVNKVDNEKIKNEIIDFYRFGFDRLYAVSALHNIGMKELIDNLVAELPKVTLKDKKATVIKVAIVGRPNTGKSSFLNYLLKEERVLVNDAPGTTRDT